MLTEFRRCWCFTTGEGRRAVSLSVMTLCQANWLLLVVVLGKHFMHINLYLRQDCFNDKLLHLCISDANVFLEVFWVLFQQSKQFALLSLVIKLVFLHHTVLQTEHHRGCILLFRTTIFYADAPLGLGGGWGPPSRRHKASHLRLCSVIQPQPLTQHTASPSSLRSKATSEAAAKTKGGAGVKVVGVLQNTSLCAALFVLCSACLADKWCWRRNIQ